MFPTWDSFFTTLLEQPDTVLKIKTPEGKVRSVLHKKCACIISNLIQFSLRTITYNITSISKGVGLRAYSEFDIDIEPARLCARMLSVREQIARELAGDLKAISNMGQQIFTSYWQNAKDRRDTTQVKAKGSSTEAGDDEESSPYAFDRFSTMYINFDPRDDEEFAPSPLRKGNFDLLYNLSTQSAVVELINSENGVLVGEDEVQNKASQKFLSNFYDERLLTHFVGAQWYGKGDDFIEELMLGSPILMTRNDDENFEDKQDVDNDTKVSSNPPLEIEPMRIAEQILLRRDIIALEWMDIMQSVSADHTDIRKLQLDRLTGVAGTTPTMIIVEDGEFQ